MADDGTGALPLLRHVILNDAKSATYKLGLLRALCRAAEQDGLVPRLDLRVGARFGATRRRPCGRRCRRRRT